MNFSIVSAFSVPKDGEFPESNEDCFGISESQGRIVIADGASESYDSKSWAQILCKWIVKNSEISAQTITFMQGAYNNQYKYNELSWSQQSAFDRGSFASILVVDIDVFNQNCQLTSIGDCCAILLHANNTHKSFPYTSSEQFFQRPILISTNPASNTFLDSINQNSEYRMLWIVSPGDTLLLMTDALGQWALKDDLSGNPNLLYLNNLQSQEELNLIVTSAREQKEIRRDDTTLITIKFYEP